MLKTTFIVHQFVCNQGYYISVSSTRASNVGPDEDRMCGPSASASASVRARCLSQFAVHRCRCHDINFGRPTAGSHERGQEMEAFDHVATNDDTNRQVGRLNYLPLCRAVQVPFRPEVRGRKGRHSECLHLLLLPSFLRLSL